MVFGMTGTAPLRPVAPVKKEKARNDVCGAAQAIVPPPHSTRQKEKARNDVCGAAQAICKPPRRTRQKRKSKK